MRTYTVFMADDESGARQHLKALLARYPEFQVSPCAASGTEALERLGRGGYDLAFLDIGMPGHTGIEVLRALKAAGSPLPYVIFVTAYTNHGAEAYELGAVDYLVKPVSEARLAAALERFRRFSGSDTAFESSADSLEDTLARRYGLTAREAAICRLVRDGLVREDIQDRLGLSPGTMKTHLSHVYEKVGLEGDDGRGDKFSRLLYVLFTMERSSQ